MSALAPAPRRRHSRAKPKPPRPRSVVLCELRALGGLVLEQGLQCPQAAPPQSLVAWAARLAAELGCAPAAAPATHLALMRRVADVHRDARANPGRATRALPAAA